VQRILTTALEEVCARFEELRPGLDAMAEALVERESLTGEEAMEAVRGALSPGQAALLRGRASVVEIPETVKDAISEDGQRARDQAGVA
jgi:cell division protease FtsH